MPILHTELPGAAGRCTLKMHYLSVSSRDQEQKHLEQCWGQHALDDAFDRARPEQQPGQPADVRRQDVQVGKKRSKGHRDSVEEDQARAYGKTDADSDPALPPAQSQVVPDHVRRVHLQDTRRHTMRLAMQNGLAGHVSCHLTVELDECIVQRRTTSGTRASRRDLLIQRL